MGRRRKTNRHLPERMYCKAGTYYFLDSQGKYYGLGRDYFKAIAKYAQIRGPQGPLTSMNSLVDRYIQEVSPNKAPATYKKEVRYSQYIKAAFGEASPDQIKPRGIYSFRDEIGKRGQVQANRTLALMSCIFSKAVEWGVVDSNPCKQVKRYTETPRNRYITNDEYNAFISIAPPLIAAYCDFKLLTGLRRQDILSLSKSQLRDEGIYIQTGKSGKKLIIEWSDELKTAVYIAKNLPRPIHGLYLFCTRKGQRYTPDGFSSIWQRTMRKALKEGVITERFTEHDIRAKTGSDAEGLDHASRLLTHSNSKTTEQHYRRKTPIVKPLR
jgi:integrase